MNTDTARTRTLTIYRCHLAKGGQRDYLDAEFAAAESRRLERIGHGRPRIEVISHTYGINDVVSVRAFGAWRYGVVASFGRTLVRVDYQRNQSGTWATRNFSALEIRPATEDTPARVR